MGEGQGSVKLPDLCDLCGARTAQGREPSCVHHCLANVMYYDTIDKLALRLAEKPKQALFVPQYKPREAKGKFVPKNKLDCARHQFVVADVSANESFSTSSHRSDSRTSTGRKD